MSLRQDGNPSTKPEDHPTETEKKGLDKTGTFQPNI